MAPEIAQYNFASGSPAVWIEEDWEWAKRQANLPSEHARLSDSFDGPAFGLQPWASSQVLCRLLALGLHGPQPSDTVVEVGAGCGLPGLLAVAQRRQRRSCEESGSSTSSNGSGLPPPPPPVLLTDYQPQVLDALRRNVALNGFDAMDVEVAALDFRAPGDCQALLARGPVDWVIAADVVYDDRLWHDLLSTFAFLCRLGREDEGSSAGIAETAALQNGAASPDLQRDTDPREAPPQRRPCRVLLACEARAQDAGVRLVSLAREAGFRVEGPLDLPSEAFRWGVVRERRTGSIEGRPADVELERVRPEGHGVLVLTLAEVK
ncbi:unnamed protein product [Prorocentrum cordatum]|uniref:Calmodulin-lysine N-methyltransferase n=1 Tax=Prorocentrum cordatum TaxID=2364126 RepID=A0ABN9RI08_9DINO|nr:unnamed protein product [Polarella glacialis]